MRYPHASTEPLEIIRVNECEADWNLATHRFQALWNEIERLRAENDALKAADRDHLSAKNGMEKRLGDLIDRLTEENSRLRDLSVTNGVRGGNEDA